VLYIAMRYVAGGDCHGLLKRERQLPAAQVAAIISAVASALDAAHAAGLVHRDVKPANILLDIRPGRPNHVYLSDFGLSKGALAAAKLTRSGMFLGTPDYTAPEQIQGQPVSGQADQYGLACTAFELLSGEPVFMREHGMAIIYAHMSEAPPRLQSRRPDLPAAADAVLARGLAKAPEDRFGSCQEFAEALRRSLDLVTVPPVALPGPTPALAAPAWAPAGPAAVPAYPAPAGPAAVPSHPAPAAEAEADPAPAAPVSPTGAAPPPVAVAGAAPVPVAASQVPAPVAGPGQMPAAARVTGTAGHPPSTGPGPGSQTETLPVPGGGTPPVPVPVPVPPGRSISRRTLLVTGAAAVPVAAGAGLVLWKALRPSRNPRWQTSVPGGQAAMLAADGDLVVAAGGPAAHALDASTGRPKWSARLADGTVAGLAVTPSVVYLVLDPAEVSPFLALSASSGSRLWTAPFASRHGLVTTPGYVYVGTSDLFALHSGNGSPQWDIVTQLKSNVVTQAGVLYTLAAGSGSPTRLGAINSADGTWRWRVPGPDSGLLAADGRVVCAAEGPGSGDPGRLWAWRASDGSKLWQSGPGGYGPPAMGGGAVYAVSQNRKLTAFRAASGHRLWSHPADPRITPVVSGPVVYAGDPSGGLLALRASDGKLLWSAGHAFSTGPVVAGGSVYVSNGVAVWAYTA
ncbi:MAG TPA: serine/threonine-protein kinase, partial [Streptosporangiaceae bacterium]